MTLRVDGIEQGLCEALLEHSAQDHDLAKVIEENRIIKVANKTGESAGSFSSGVVSGLGLQRVAVSDLEIINRSYFALFQEVSRLEAEKGDLQMQIQLDAVAYKVVQELKEDLTATTAEIGKNQVEIAESKVKSDQSYPAISSDLVSSSSPDAASVSDCKPGRSFLHCNSGTMAPQAQSRRTILQSLPVGDDLTCTMVANLSIADAYFFEELGARAPELMQTKSEEYKYSLVRDWSSPSLSTSAAKSFDNLARYRVQTVESPTRDDFQMRFSKQISEPLARLHISALESDASVTDTVHEDWSKGWSTSKMTAKYGLSAGLLFTDAAHILLDASSESTSSPFSLPVPLARAQSLP